MFVEEAVFFGAYVMRKLDDSQKLSTSWRGTTVKCTRFPPTSKRRPSLVDWHRIDQHYDLSKPNHDTMGARRFCDLVVHSFIFLELLSYNRRIEGFFIASDQLKAKGLWQFSVNSVIGLMRQTAGDWPAMARVIRDPETGETATWAGKREPPEEWTRKAEKLAREWASKLLPKAND